MKRIIGALLATAAIAAFAVGVAVHKGIKDANAADPAPVLLGYYEALATADAGGTQDGGAVGTGAISSPRYCDEAEVFADNADATIDRRVVVKWLGSDGTTSLYTAPQVWVQHASKAGILISPRASGATAATGETVWPLPLGAKMQATLEADGGTGSASLGYYCRSAANR